MYTSILENFSIRFLQNPLELSKPSRPRIEAEATNVVCIPLVLRYHPLYKWAVAKAGHEVAPPEELVFDSKLHGRIHCHLSMARCRNPHL